jgi:hypothetical protein
MMAFVGGAVVGLINFFSMFAFFAKRNPYAAFSCLIWAFLLPIIGFGCCASGIRIGG